MELNATELRRRILSLLDDLPEEGITITKRGEPRARLVPVRRQRKGRYVTAPLVAGKGSPGALCPKEENPYDLLFD
jgi:prevent-host-death family protein